MDYHRTSLDEALPEGQNLREGSAVAGLPVTRRAAQPPVGHGRGGVQFRQRAHPDRHQHRDRRQGGSGQTGPDRAAGPGPPAPGGRPRGGQDPPREDSCPHHRLFGEPHPVHPRSAPLRCHGRVHLQPGVPVLRVPARGGVREYRHRRRNQPRLGQDAVGPAGMHGRTPGHRGRQVLQTR